MQKLARSVLFGAMATFLALSPGHAQEIPYRYSVSEGFILAIDDASRRAISREDGVSWAVLNGLADMLESDQYRIPIEYARTLAWNVGTPIAAGTQRAAQLETFELSRQQSADRSVPAHVLFLRLTERDGKLLLRADGVDLVRGESRLRLSSDPVAVALPPDCDIKQACAGQKAVEALTPFFQTLGDKILALLGPAPPRGYGDVPPPWLIEPVSYRIDMRGLNAADAATLADAMTVEFDYYLDHRITREEEGRLTLAYETIAPSWWLAQELRNLAADLDLTLDITPISGGLRIE